MTTPTPQAGEFDRRAQAWVQRHYGVTPDLGSVEFGVDAAAYTSGAWCNFDVSWEVGGVTGAANISDSAWSYDVTGLIRELVETGVPAGAGGEQE